MIADTQTAPHSSPSPKVSKGSRKGLRAKSVCHQEGASGEVKIRAGVSSGGPNLGALRTVNMTQLEGQGCPSPPRFSLDEEWPL